MENLLSSPLFAQANGASQGSLVQTLIMIGVVFFFFYFILWRPERKRRKSLQSLRENMKVGDKVTVMGILGTIDKIQETTVVLKTVDGSKIEVLKAAISEVAATDKVEVVKKEEK